MYQNILLIGSFILLSVILFSINNLIFMSNKTILENEVQITGIGLAQTLMEEITSRAFDEKTTGNQRVQFPTKLTLQSEFGKETNEPPFDDVDDYHDCSQNIDTPRIDGYQLHVSVHYANPLFPKYNFPFRSFLKRIQITVKNEKYMSNPDSLVISSIVAYY